MGRRYTRVHHLLHLVRIIEGTRGLNAADLAKRCERHERTIYRDLDTLNASGIPCDFDPETNGYRIRRGFFMPPVELTYEEAMSMVALLERVDDQTQIPFLETARRVAEKIRSQLPAAVLEEMEPLDGHLQIDLARTMADDSPRDVYETMREAIATRRAVRCTYEPVTSAHAEAEFELLCYKLWYCQRAWYVVGHHCGRDAVRMLKLNRFTFARLTERPYAIPDDFDLANVVANAWRMVRGPQRFTVAIRFDPARADTATETRWHPTQQEQWHEDGSATLRFEIDGLDEIVWWVLGYGPHAKVIEPPELIERVRELAKATAERYQA